MSDPSDGPVLGSIRRRSHKELQELAKVESIPETYDTLEIHFGSNGMDCRLWLNGRPMNTVFKATVAAEAGDLTRVTLEMYPSDPSLWSEDYVSGGIPPMVIKGILVNEEDAHLLPKRAREVASADD